MAAEKDFTNFKSEFIQVYGLKDFKIIMELLEQLINNDFVDIDIENTEWSLFTLKTDRGPLQEDVEIALTRVSDNIMVLLEYENGINNGTILIGYRLNN